jgi:hypothetical protein
MKKASILIGILFTLLCLNGFLVYAMAPAPEKAGQTKTVDVNQDGKPDVTYHSTDGKNITKIEADTNYDGKPDVVVHAKDGKFQSAKIDADYNGSMETEINDAAQFKQWINTNRPGFKETIGRAGWQEFGGMSF